MEPVISVSALMLIGKIIGTITASTTTLFGVFKVYNWIKGKFVSIDSNVTALKSTMEEGFKNLSEDLKQQTTSVVGELKEQRADFRTFYAPTLLMMQQAASTIRTQPVPVKAKRSRKKITRKA